MPCLDALIVAFVLKLISDVGAASFELLSIDEKPKSSNGCAICVEPFCEGTV